MSPGAGLEEHEPNSSSAACYLARALGVSHGRDRVRLRMHGEIRLGSWRAFRARQVTVAGRGMVWEASVRMMGLTVRGYDRLLDGRGEMLWKLLGLVPVMRRSGADVTRSAAGRMAAESVWLPQMLLDAGVDCRDVDGGFAASLDVCGHRQEVRFRLDSDGRLLALRMKRWGDPDGRGHRLVDFGGIALEESTFDGVKIPSRMRIGWFWDGSGFRGDGEFFRVAIDAAEFG